MLVFWPFKHCLDVYILGFEKKLIYCGDKFGDFQQKVGDFFVRTSGHSAGKTEFKFQLF